MIEERENPKKIRCYKLGSPAKVGNSNSRKKTVTVASAGKGV
jgi:hypothetical protein